jgi:serine/threonine protein phosphatase PrpC
LGSRSVDIDRRTLAVEEGDQIVVCTDGLLNELSGEEVTSAMVRGGEKTAIVHNLIEKAMTHCGRDNVSTVVAEVAV